MEHLEFIKQYEGLKNNLLKIVRMTENILEKYFESLEIYEENGEYYVDVTYDLGYSESDIWSYEYNIKDVYGCDTKINLFIESVLEKKRLKEEAIKLAEKEKEEKKLKEKEEKELAMYLKLHNKYGQGSNR